jgi:hypothetical protein
MEGKTPMEKLRELGLNLPDEFAAFPVVLLDEVAVTWASKGVMMSWSITSIRIEARQERLTTDPGAVLLREIMERLGIVGWLAERIANPRRPELVVHPT